MNPSIILRATRPVSETPWSVWNARGKCLGRYVNQPSEIILARVADVHGAPQLEVHRHGSWQFDWAADALKR